MTIRGTLALGEAARRTWGAAVVGAGPAGALAAHELARRGVATLLIDQAAFPRAKVCGCCLSARGIATLAAAGLGDLPARCGAVPLRAFELAAGGASARLAVSGVVLSRGALDAALVGAAVAAGAHFLPQARAALVAGGGAAGTVRLVSVPPGGAVAVRARCVLAADGLGGQLLTRAGVGEAPAAAGARVGVGAVSAEAPAYYRAGTVYMACGARGYVGLVRLEDGRLDVAAALDAAWVRASGGPGRAALPLLAAAGLPPVPGLLDLAWRGTPALTRRATRVAGERLFVLGDAAGYVEPFTGEGMAWALAGGLAVAPLAAEAARRWRPSLAAAWAATYRRVVVRRQYLCRAAAAVLRRPLLARAIVRVLARVPALATPLLRHLNR
ncbi:MAG TPA: FAD-dependent monooxygenase [Gemmataceae bacterium]|nr:FAD-dependent monooxygenase [Gemmataceae bacterium]